MIFLIEEENINKSGIYFITNKLNNRIYIGSCVNFRKRFNAHICRLKNKKHANSFLQNDWNKCGENCFEFKKIDLVDEYKDRIFAEQTYIDYYFDFQNQCYNLSRKAELPKSIKGIKLSKEHKAKLSLSKTGKRRTGLFCEKLSKRMLGNQYTLGMKHKEETKEKISKSHSKKIWNIKIISPTGEIFGPIINLNQFAKEHKINSKRFYEIANGKRKQYKGWKLI